MGTTGFGFEISILGGAPKRGGSIRSETSEGRFDLLRASEVGEWAGEGGSKKLVAA